jgi:hypothetical protein
MLGNPPEQLDSSYKHKKTRRQIATLNVNSIGASIVERSRRGQILQLQRMQRPGTPTGILLHREWWSAGPNQSQARLAHPETTAMQLMFRVAG